MNEGECTRKVEIRARKKFLVLGKTCMAIFWPTPGFTGKTFVSSGFLMEGTLISASTVPTVGPLNWKPNRIIVCIFYMHIISVWLELRFSHTARCCRVIAWLLCCWHKQFVLLQAECPLCREQFPPHRLVALQNYDPVWQRKCVCVCVRAHACARTRMCVCVHVFVCMCKILCLVWCVCVCHWVCVYVCVCDVSVYVMQNIVEYGIQKCDVVHDGELMCVCVCVSVCDVSVYCYAEYCRVWYPEMWCDTWWRTDGICYILSINLLELFFLHVFVLFIFKTVHAWMYVDLYASHMLPDSHFCVDLRFFFFFHYSYWRVRQP